MTAPTAGVLDKLQRRTLMTILAGIPDRLEDLQITITRTDSMAPMRLGSTGHTIRAIPFNEKASDARTALEKLLRIYALRVAFVRDIPAPHSPSAQAAYLINHLPAIPDDAPSIENIYSIVHASDTARRAIDLPPERSYIGNCECGAGLYAGNDGVTSVACRKCATTHNVDTKRDATLDYARDHIASAAELARFLPWFAGTPIRANTISRWAARGKLQAVDVPGVKIPQYRIGDVIALHEAAADALADTENSEAA